MSNDDEFFKSANIGVLGIGGPGGPGVVGIGGPGGPGVVGIAAGGRKTEAPVPRVVQTFHGAVGAVQNGDGASAVVNQTVGIDLAALRGLLDELERRVEHEVAPEQIVEARELVALAKAEVANGPPSTSTKLRAYLGALKGIVSDGLGGFLAEVLKKVLLDGSGGSS